MMLLCWERNHNSLDNVCFLTIAKRIEKESTLLFLLPGRRVINQNINYSCADYFHQIIGILC